MVHSVEVAGNMWLFLWCYLSRKCFCSLSAEPSPASACWPVLSSSLSTKRSWKPFVLTTVLESTARWRSRRQRWRWVSAAVRKSFNSTLLKTKLWLYLWSLLYDKIFIMLQYKSLVIVIAQKEYKWLLRVILSCLLWGRGVVWKIIHDWEHFYGFYDELAWMYFNVVLLTISSAQKASSQLIGP